MTRSLRRFFEDYARAASSDDPLAPERFFADACMAAAPGFAACTPDRERLRDALTNLSAYYARIGRGPLRLEGLDETDLGDRFTLATAHWSTTLGSDPDEVRFTVSYLVERADPPRVVCFVAHEDERAILAQHGIAT